MNNQNKIINQDQIR